MAERRMFAKMLIDSDSFLDMPPTAQNLYFHLSMRADDDGFVNSPRKIQRMVSAADDDLKLLLAKGYIIAFESGVIVIKHWKMHNYIQKDRYKPTIYQHEKSLLEQGENGMYTECIQDVSTLDTQDREDKSIDSLSNILCAPDEPAHNPLLLKKEKNTSEKPKTCKHKYGEYQNVLLSDGELDKLKNRFHDYQERIERLSGYIASKGAKYKSHYATICNWANNEVQKNGPKINSTMTDLDHLF